MPRGDAATFDARSVVSTMGINSNSGWGVEVKNQPGYPDTPLASGGEQHISTNQPDGVTAYETTAWLQSLGGEYVVTDLRGSGLNVRVAGKPGDYLRATVMSQMGGVVRQWDIDQGVIRHTLAVALSRNILSTNFVWPAYAQDSYASGNTGFVPEGSLLAIPSNVAMPSGLSRVGQMIWTALRNYGAYVVDGKNDFYGTGVIDAEAGSAAAMNTAAGDLAKIFTQVRLVTNQSQTNVGGPGNRLAPTAPPLP